jgi:ABC-type glycerol-3-phosphate transport system substrate-binding protein
MAHRRRLAAAAIVASLVIVACGGDDEDTTEGTDASSETTAAAGGTETTAAEGGSDTTAASGEKPFDGTTVTIMSSIRDVEAERLETAWASFEEETGIDIVHEGTATFEDDLKLRVDGGDAPDLAFIPQPGLLATLATDGKVVPLADLADDVAANNGESWVGYGTVDGTFYAPPFGANIKSLVWYSPEAFADRWLRDPHHLAGAARPQPADRRRRRRAVVRRRRVRWRHRLGAHRLGRGRHAPHRRAPTCTTSG